MDFAFNQRYPWTVTEMVFLEQQDIAYKISCSADGLERLFFQA
jgi:hypothetical protein